MRLLLFVVVAACARPALVADVPDRPQDAERHYTIWLGGSRVGTAIERETWHGDELVLRRDESLRFYRDASAIVLSTQIEIRASAGLVASRVSWRERSGNLEQHAEATRDQTGGWRTSTGAMLAAEAVPAELVPLLTRRDRRFAGRVFLPARGFLSGDGRIDAVAPARLVARLALDGGAASSGFAGARSDAKRSAVTIVEATIDLDADGNYARVVDGEGVIALRATPGVAAEPFQPVDLVAATAIPINGAPSKTLIVDTGIAMPPVPGQLARRDSDGVALELSPQLPGNLPYGAFGRDRSREIGLLVSAVRARIAPDLAAHPGSPRTAESATAGDCTTFALAYTALASGRAIPTRVVTGFRIDGRRLVRHRWAVSWTGTAWMAVDAAFGSAPAGGDLIGLALHGADDAGLVAGEAALAQVRGASWR